LPLTVALAAPLPHHRGGARDARRVKRAGVATRWCHNPERRRYTMNETPMMFSGLEAQGEINRMEEVFGGPEQIYRGVSRGRKYYEMKTLAEDEAEKPGRAGLKRERVPKLNPTIT